MRRSLRLLTLSLAGCAPELEDRPYLLGREQLIAAVAEPPEVRPGAEIRVTPIGAPREVRAGAGHYGFCAQAPPPADPRTVAEACFREDGRALSADDDGARGNVPADACARFGPDPVGSGFRPRDADATGGFYQPLVIEGFGPPSVAQVRVLCPLPDVPVDLARAYVETYTPNRNPTGLKLERETSDGWRPLERVGGGEQVKLRVTWDPAARERYVWVAPDASELEPRVESMSVAWFTTGGTLAEARTGRAEDDPSSDSENGFEAPAEAGTVRIWAVVHDSRGGSAVVSERVQIAEP